MAATLRNDDLYCLTLNELPLPQEFAKVRDSAMRSDN